MVSDRFNPFGTEARCGRLESCLSILPEQHRVAFATWCSERLRPAFEALARFLGTGDADVLKGIHERLWTHVVKEALTGEQVVSLLDDCDRLDTGDENCCSHWDAAIDAVDATWFALQACRGNSAENAAKSGECLVNRVYQRLVEERLGKSYMLTPDDSRELGAWIEGHPLMRSEYARQFSLVGFLRSHPRLGQSEVQVLRQTTLSE